MLFFYINLTTFLQKLQNNFPIIKYNFFSVLFDSLLILEQEHCEEH